MTGFALVAASFWFDGHTVSKGPWALHSLVNLVHLGAAAVGGGGVGGSRRILDHGASRNGWALAYVPSRSGW